MNARLFNNAETSLPCKLLRTCLESCASIVQAAVCRPPRYWPDELRRPPKHPRQYIAAAEQCPLKNRPKSTPAHGSVAAAVSHKHHSIIRIGAGLIQFVHGRTCSSAAEVIPNKFLFLPFFPASFCLKRDQLVYIYMWSLRVLVGAWFTLMFLDIRCSYCRESSAN